MPEFVKRNPHVAFRVDSSSPYRSPGVEIIIPPFVVGDFLEVVFVKEVRCAFRIHATISRTAGSEIRPRDQLPRHLHLCLGSCRGRRSRSSCRNSRRSVSIRSPLRKLSCGKFLRPHGKTGKVYFPEDGTVYFKASEALWRDKAGRQFAAQGTRCNARALQHKEHFRTNAWLVPAQYATGHDASRGGPSPMLSATAMSIACVHLIRNVRAYAVGLARDVTESYPVSGLSMESPGFAALCTWLSP